MAGSTYGTIFKITTWGESHGKALGVVIDGCPAWLPLDESDIQKYLNRRKPGTSSITTPRKEDDTVEILSGVFEGKTTGTPIMITIPNQNTKSKDYSATRFLARPGHADYTANCKYHGFEDYRGGGHFSGRITAGLVAAGAIAIAALKNKGIRIGTHISRCAGVSDRPFGDVEADIAALNEMTFAVLDTERAAGMEMKITQAAESGDSVGGILETVVVGMPAGVGEPWFDTVESVLSHILFSIPGIKGVQFGMGFAMADRYGSEANDNFRMDGEKIVTVTNNNGGINGGITNGMPLQFSCAVKPTPSIYKEQDTVNFAKKENAPLQIAGRHDPAIIHRARVVVDSAVAIALCDLLAQRYGTDFLA